MRNGECLSTAADAASGSFALCGAKKRICAISQVCARGHRLLSATWFCIGFQIMTFAMMAAMNREHMNSEEEEIPRLDNDTGAMLR